MCFGKPKMKSPKITKPTPAIAPPIETQTPKVVDGTEQADSNRAKRRNQNPNQSLSLFEIQLIPGATATTADAPGAVAPGMGA